MILGMRIIKATQARTEFQDIIDSAYYREEPVVILKRKKPWVIITKLDQTDPQIKEEVEKFLNDEKLRKG